MVTDQPTDQEGRAIVADFGLSVRSLPIRHDLVPMSDTALTDYVDIHVFCHYRDGRSCPGGQSDGNKDLQYRDCRIHCARGHVGSVI